jgi:hypothetical protein
VNAGLAGGEAGLELIGDVSKANGEAIFRRKHADFLRLFGAGSSIAPVRDEGE